jgi:chemotaxis protein MotB
MSLRRKIYDGSVLRRSDGNTKRGNTLNSQIQINELIATKRTRHHRQSIDDDSYEHHEESNAERYLLTYADLITLLLGLFIILYAVSNVDASKYENMMQDIGEYFGNEHFADPEYKSSYLDMSDNRFTLKSSLQKMIEEYNYSNNIRLIENERGITISIMDNILFESGKAQLSEYSKPVLNKMAQLLKTLPNDIRIEGHTDNVPISTEEFPSNWHLSIARATNTGYFLMNDLGLSQERVSVVGNSEFKPLDDNNSVESRALNRRVDIVILNK